MWRSPWVKINDTTLSGLELSSQDFASLMNSVIQDAQLI